jgi:hypothetical protein
MPFYTLPIMTITTLTILRTFQPRIITLTIFFLAQRLLASTLPHRYITRYPLKVVRLTGIYNALRAEYLLLETSSIVTTHAHTTGYAVFPPSETLTVQFQTVDLCALATSLEWLSGGQVELIDQM